MFLHISAAVAAAVVVVVDFFLCYKLVFPLRMSVHIYTAAAAAAVDIAVIVAAVDFVLH